MHETPLLQCSLSHSPDWLVTYDIGNKEHERLLVCKECFFDSSDSSFRQYVISKSELKEGN